MINLEQLLAREQQLQKQIEQIEQDKKDAIEAEKIEKRIVALEEQIRQTGNEPEPMKQVGQKTIIYHEKKPINTMEQIIEKIAAEQAAKKPCRITL